MEDYQIIIIGGGPAGLTAGLYASRAQLQTVLLEAMIPSGQAYMSERIENYPGFPDGVSGKELIERFAEQATKFGLEIAQFTKVEKVDLAGAKKMVMAGGKRFLASALIIASGAQANKLGVPGEHELAGKGVSYCATCDGAFFEDQEVAVVGGGDWAVEDALYLTRMARKILLVHRRDELRAQKILQSRVLGHPKIELIWNTVVKEIKGEGMVKTLVLENVKERRQEEFAVGRIVPQGSVGKDDLGALHVPPVVVEEIMVSRPDSHLLEKAAPVNPQSQTQAVREVPFVRPGGRMAVDSYVIPTVHSRERKG